MAVSEKIAVIGAGNLGGALLGGLAASRVVPDGNLGAADISNERLAEAAKVPGVSFTTSDNKALADWADVLIVAVKPPWVAPVLDGVKDSIRNGQLVISLAAGVPLSTIEENLPTDQPAIRAMPNIAMMVQASATAVCGNKSATADHIQLALEIFSAVGEAVVVHEAQMDAVTGLSGSGPAYVFLLIEALAAGGVKTGLTPVVASRLAAQTLLGAAKMAIESGVHPGTLRDQVTTPGGTTIAGLHALEVGGVRGACMDAVEKAAQRSAELAK